MAKEIMLDTNVLYSAIFHPNERMLRLISKIAREHFLVISEEVLDELFEIANRKAKDKISAIGVFFENICYLSASKRSYIEPNLFEIRDMKDYPILYAAIVVGVDVFITGDKDFDEVDIARPEILTPTEFLEKY